MALYWNDIRFPSRLVRSSEDKVSRGDGLVRPRLLNIGSILGVGAWKGLPMKHGTGMTELARSPSCGADIIVSILHRHSPKTLSDFFAVTNFEFVHINEAVDLNMPPKKTRKFVIGRQGDLVKAGFLEELLVNEVVPQEWTGFVEYELLRNPSNGELLWRQLTLREQGDPSKEKRGVPNMLLDRAIWELDAVTILAPALSERRWMERAGGFQVKVALHSTQVDLFNRTESEKHDQAERSMSEADYDAEGDTTNGDSPPTLDGAVSNEHTTVVIPGTEDFDDVRSLLRAAEAKKKTRYGRPSTGHRFGKLAPELSQA